MKKKFTPVIQGCRLFLVVLTGLASLVTSTYTPAEEAEFVIGVFPRRTPSEMLEMFNPLATHLSQN